MGSPWTKVRSQGQGRTQRAWHLTSGLPTKAPPTEEERVGGELASCLSQVVRPHPALACLPDVGLIDKQNASIRRTPGSTID